MARTIATLSPYRLLLAALALGLLANCAGQPGPRDDTAPDRLDSATQDDSLVLPEDTDQVEGLKTIRLGLLLPLSGSSTPIGEALLEAAQLALFDMRERQIVLLPRDTKGTPEGAAEAAQAAIADGAEVLLGPVFASSITAVATIAREKNIAVIGFSTDRTVAGRGIYILGFTPEDQIVQIIDYAAQQGITKFAALIPQSSYGERIMGVLEQAIVDRESELIQVELYPEDTNGFTEPVKRLANYDARRTALLEEQAALKAFGPDDDFALELLAMIEDKETLGEVDYEAVLVPAGGALLRSLAPLLPYYEIDPNVIQFLGTGLWDDPGLRLEPALLGAWFAGPRPEAAQAFGTHFRNAYGRTPPRLASLAYDAIALAVHQLRSGKESLFTRRALTDRNGFVGIDGLFRFRRNGVAERALAVIEITEEGLNPITAPLTRFPPPRARKKAIGPKIDPEIKFETDQGPATSPAEDQLSPRSEPVGPVDEPTSVFPSIQSDLPRRDAPPLQNQQSDDGQVQQPALDGQAKRPSSSAVP